MMRLALCLPVRLSILASLGLRLATAQDTSVGGSTKENLDLPYDAVGNNDDDEDSPEVVSFFGQTLEGDGFFYVIDKSGSMNDSGELGLAKREVVKNIREFSDRVQFGIVFFAGDVVKFPQNGQPAEASPSMKSSSAAWIQSTQSSHGSCPQAGFTAIIQFANQSTAKRKVIVYLGDGGGTCPGGDSEDAYLRKTVSSVSSQNYQRVQINTIGVLQYGQIQEKFMKDIAAMNGGTYTKLTR